MGSQELRDLYQKNSSGFNFRYLNDFAKLCFTGDIQLVRVAVESGAAPDLKGTETPYRFGYCTLVIAGAQRVLSGPSYGMHYAETLKYLLSRRAPPDVPDIVGSTALHHATMTKSSKVPLARILLENGANPDAQDRYGGVPMLAAFQTNQIAALDLLLEFGTRLDIKDSDYMCGNNMHLICGPEATAVVRKWERKRSGEEGLMEEKRCNFCGKQGGGDVKLKNCSKCHVARYCSRECQRSHWPKHKTTCNPFSDATTVTIRPRDYVGGGDVLSNSDFIRSILGITGESTPAKTKPRPRPKTNEKFPRSMILKVQVPYDGPNKPVDDMPQLMMVYNKGRDFQCQILRADDVAVYDRIDQVVRGQGVGGAKAYFAAELKSWDELVIKIGDVLAEQPW